MPKAIFNGKVIAESDQTESVEGNHYFPADSLKKEYFTPTEHKTVCGWKGKASYYTISVDGKEARNAAWYYPTPKPAAEHLKGRVAFYRTKVEIQ